MSAPLLAPRCDIRISGVTLAADLTDQIMSVTVETDLDLAGSFSIMLYNRDNTLLDSALLDLGKTVEIHLGYGTSLTPALLGEIAAIEPSFPGDGPPTIMVSGYDKSYKMRNTQPKPTSYTWTNDSLIAAEIAIANGLVPVVDPTPSVQQHVVKAASDMAFLKSRAQQYFFDVYVEWDRLHFQFPRPQLAAHVLEWGTNLSSFQPRISAVGMAGLQVIRGYNQELAQSILGVALAADFDVDNLVEKLGTVALDLLGSLAREGILQQPVSSPLDATQLAQSLLANLLDGMYEGSGSCIGLPDLVAGSYLTIGGIGRRFSGTYRVRKVTHRLSPAGFTTDFSITQRSHSSLMGLLRSQLADEPPPNKAQPFYGVTLGEVVDNNELADPQAVVPTGRVKLRLPAYSQDLVSAWAPCAAPFAGAGAGFYALPDQGDQVLVAFEEGDINRPYVLGSLWTTQSRPPAANLDGTNSQRVIKSRSGHAITFDDTSDGGDLTIADKSGSTISLNARDGSVTISAQGDLTISAKGDLTIKADGTVTIQAAGGGTTISMNQDAVDVS